MRNLQIILLCLFAAVANASAQTPKWSELLALIGVPKSSPVFADFISHYGLTERPRNFGNGRRSQPPFFANDSGIAVFVDSREVVFTVHLSPGPTLDLSTCLPIPAGEPPTKAAILSSLELTEAAAEDRGSGIRAYTNRALGVGMKFQGEAPAPYLIYFSASYPPKNAPRNTP